jgi:tRNA A37 methylthiotransferase MiaB
VKRERLNGLLAVQESIGHERNAAWLGRSAEVLVEAVVADRGHDHEPAGEGSAAEGDGAHLTGRTRHHKLVHLTGPAALVGRLAEVRIEHAGPYALRGSLVGAAG